MPRASADDVLDHWSTFRQECQTSPLAFYEAVEAAIQRRQIPNASTSRVDWKEGGVLAARREYLRVTRGKLIFDICAAPFGTGFFFVSNRNGVDCARPPTGSPICTPW